MQSVSVNLSFKGKLFSEVKCETFNIKLELQRFIQISYFNFKLQHICFGNAWLTFTVVLGHFRLHKWQRFCPNKLVNAKSKKSFGTDGRTEWHGHYLSCSSQLKKPDSPPNVKRPKLTSQVKGKDQKYCLKPKGSKIKFGSYTNEKQVLLVQKNATAILLKLAWSIYKGWNPTSTAVAVLA